jgi:transcriptional regulator with XRE-family HTH domain
MSKLTISDQIRTLRKSKGLSQEALAVNAGINLRTLQRIESHGVVPRGETLRMLAKALNVTMEELIPVGTPLLSSPEEDLGFLKLMNLAALTFWFIPLGNIFIPLALWIYRKSKIQGAAELGKRILNFQITWTLGTYGLAYLSLFNGYIQINPYTMLAVMLMLFAGNTIFIISTHRKITRGNENVYPYSLKLIR